MPIYDVRHQGRALRLIQRALDGGRIAHAYIFYGPDGVGKELFARRLAAILLCASRRRTPAADLPDDCGWDRPIIDACGSCRSCHLADAGTHPDLHLVHRYLNVHHPDPDIRKRKAVDLGVGVIRHFLIAPCGIKPAMGQARVFIVREADRISPGAQNALLKTLEEPPPTVHLILLAESTDRLLPTTRSRCQLVTFGGLPRDFVARRLMTLVESLTADDARLYAALSGGSVGTALRFAAQNLIGVNEQVVTALSSLSRSNALQTAGQFVAIAKQLAQDQRRDDPALSDTAALRRGLSIILRLAATFYDDALRIACDAGHLPANAWAGDRVERIARTAGADALDKMIPVLAGAEWALGRSVNTQLAVESLMFDLVNAAAGQPITAVAH